MGAAGRFALATKAATQYIMVIPPTMFMSLPVSEYVADPLEGPA